VIAIGGMTRWVVRYAVALSLPLLCACGTNDRRQAALGPIDSLASPAGPGSGEPNLAAGADGRVVLSWLEPVGDSAHALRFATFDGERWSEPRTVTQRSDLFVNWADFPSVVPLADRRIAAHWLQRSGSEKYAYDVRIAQSSDNGATWSTPVVPHRDGTATEHGFVSLFSFRDSLGAVWLDGRSFSRAPQGTKADMMLIMTSIASTGATGPERVLDERVCDCCQTSLAVASTGPVLVYRDRSPEEVRDISVVRWSDSGWTTGKVLHADGWNIDFCPVNGPAVDAAGNRVAVGWFTSPRDSARVYVAFSDDSGISFGPPTRIDEGRPVGRVAIRLTGEGAVVSWMEFTSGQRADVRARYIGADGALGPSTVVAHSSGERASGFPRMIPVRDGLVFAWTEAGTPPRVRTARMRLPQHQ
jgi:hypothetical protein